MRSSQRALSFPQYSEDGAMPQGESDYNTDTSSACSDDDTQSGEETNAPADGVVKGGWYQLNGFPEIREIIFKEYLSELHGGILRYGNHLASSLLLPCLNVLHVCKDFVNEFAPLLRKDLALVTTWKFDFDDTSEWDDVLLHFADLKRLVASSIHYGFRFDRYLMAFKARDPGGYETAGFLAALANHLRASGATGGHDFDGKFKSWWIDWRGSADIDSDLFDYERGESDEDPVYLAVWFYGTGEPSDSLIVRIASDVATLDFQNFDWRSTKKGEYVA